MTSLGGRKPTLTKGESDVTSGHLSIFALSFIISEGALHHSVVLIWIIGAVKGPVHHAVRLAGLNDGTSAWFGSRGPSPQLHFQFKLIVLIYVFVFVGQKLLFRETPPEIQPSIISPEDPSGTSLISQIFLTGLRT